jgi:hypothetical protein
MPPIYGTTGIRIPTHAGTVGGRELELFVKTLRYRWEENPFEVDDRISEFRTSYDIDSNRSLDLG